jgi:hypothetical protein
MQTIFLPHRKHTCIPKLPLTDIALRSVQMMFVPNRKHTYRLPRPVTAIVVLALVYFDKCYS